MPCSLQLEKAHTQQQRPSTAKNKNKEFFKIKNKFNKVSGCKNQCPEICCFYIQIMNYQKVKLRKQFTLQLNQESKISRNKFNQGGEKKTCILKTTGHWWKKEMERYMTGGNNIVKMSTSPKIANRI